MVNAAARFAPCIAISLPRSIRVKARGSAKFAIWRPRMSRPPITSVRRLLKSCATAASQLSNRVHLLRLMQLLFKMTPFRHIVGADNDPAKRARLLGRRA